MQNSPGPELIFEQNLQSNHSLLYKSFRPTSVTSTCRFREPEPAHGPRTGFANWAQRFSRKFSDCSPQIIQRSRARNQNAPEKNRNLQPTVNRQPDDRGITCRAEFMCALHLEYIPQNFEKSLKKSQHFDANFRILYFFMNFINFQLLNSRISQVKLSNYNVNARVNCGWTWPHLGHDKPQKHAKNWKSQFSIAVVTRTARFLEPQDLWRHGPCRKLRCLKFEDAPNSYPKLVEGIRAQNHNAHENH